MDYECSENFNQKKYKSGNLVIKIESSDQKEEMLYEKKIILYLFFTEQKLIR